MQRVSGRFLLSLKPFFRLIYAFFLAQCFLILKPVFSTALCPELFARLKARSITLHSTTDSGNQTVQDLVNNPITVVQVKRELGSIGPDSSTMGTMNYGVYRVKMSDGKDKVLKISYEGSYTFFGGSDHFDISHAQLRRAVAIQQELAEHGFAPKIYKIIEPDHMEELATNPRGPFKNILGKDGDGKIIGIVMDEVKGGWNLSKASMPHPFLKNWNFEQLKFSYKKFRELEDALDALEISPSDTQIMVNSKGIPIFIDLDGFRMRTPNEAPARLTNQTDILIKFWEEINGTKLTPTQRAVLSAL